MAFFKFRLPGAKMGSDAGASAPLESVETMRRRARHRLIGAAVLVLIAVVGFPLVFDTQPRPVSVDVPIQIPDRAKVKSLVLPAAASGAAAPAASGSLAMSAPVRPDAPVAAPASTKAPQVAAQASLDPREEIVTGTADSKQARPVGNPASAATGIEAKREPGAAPKIETKGDVKVPATKPGDDGSRALALLDGKDVPKPAAAGGERFIVQVGAFADADKARETRLKVERVGLTTYTQVIDSPEGKRTRVRVGPFASRAEADKAAAKIRELDLPASILTL
jgi:DedD protein